MTEKEMKKFLEMIDEHEKGKQQEQRKKKARFYLGTFLFAFVLGIVINFVIR